MSVIANVSAIYYRTINAFRHIDGLPSLLLRVYLAPIFITAGLHKINHIDDIISWFGNPDWGVGPAGTRVDGVFGGLYRIFGWFLIALWLGNKANLYTSNGNYVGGGAYCTLG